MTEKTERLIRELIWHEARCSDKHERYSADSVFGSYEALEWSNGGYGGTFAPVAEGVDGNEFGGMPSIEAAKEACNRDYVMRVSELLRLEVLE